MARNRNADFHTAFLLNLICNLIRNRWVPAGCNFCLVLLLGKLCIVFGDCTFCNCKNRKSFSVFCTLMNRIHDLINIIRNLREQNNVGTACHSCIQGKPSYFVSHHLYNKYTVVGSSRCMDAIDSLCRYINCTLKTECHICSVNIIVNGLWKMNDIEPFLTKQIGSLLRTISAKDHQTVQSKLTVCGFHGLYLVQTVFIRHTHLFEWLAGRSENRSTSGKDSGKIRGCKNSVLFIDQPFVPIFKSINLQFVYIRSKSFYNTTHGCI